MKNYFTVDILTPSKIVVKDIPASSVLVPTSLGQINVLPEHTHIITALSAGEMSVFGDENDVDRHFMITHGTCKILKEKVTILATCAEEMHEIDKTRAEKALKNAEEILSSGKELTDEQIVRYRRKIDRAKLRIQLADYSNKS